MDVSIRRAAEDDAAAISPLIAQLGYSVDAAAVRERLQRLADRRAVFVAITGGAIAGWASVCTDETFVNGFESNLEGLVVDEPRRNAGIGRQLLDAAMNWARQHGCDAMLVRSNVVRERAHGFYERAGFERFKTQHNLRISL